MVPRLIVAAILVNASFYIAALAVDVSNLLGYGIANFFGSFEVSQAGTNSGDLWVTIIGGVLAVAAGLGLLALIVMAPSSLLAFAVVALILVARKAFIVLLIVIAPIAFVAYLLPNTESWFKKWYKAFIALLMVFPVIAAVFGASNLASEVLMSIANSGDVEADGPDQMLYIVALGVTAIPLFTVPAILKGSLAAAGSIGTKISGMSDKTTGYAKKKAMEGRIGEAKYAFDARRKNRAFNARLGTGKMSRTGAFLQRRGGKAGRAIGSQMKKYDVAQIGANFDQSGPGRYFGGDRGAAAAAGAADKFWDEQVSNQQKLMSINSSKFTPDLLHKIATDTTGKYSEEQSAAAAGFIMKNGAMKEIHALHGGVEAMGDTSKARNVRKQMIHDMNRTPEGFGSGDIAKMRRGEATGRATYDDMLRNRINTGKLSDAKWAKADPDDQQAYHDLAISGGLDYDQLKSLANATLDAERNENISVSDRAKEQGAEIRRRLAIEEKRRQDEAYQTYVDGGNIT